MSARGRAAAAAVIMLAILGSADVAAQIPETTLAVQSGERVRLLLHDGSALVATLLRRDGDALSLRPHMLIVSPDATFAALRVALPDDTLALRLTQPRLNRLTFHSGSSMVVLAALVDEVQVQRGSVPARRNTAEVFAYAATATGGGLAVASALAGAACQCGVTWRMAKTGGGVGLGVALIATLAEARRREPHWVPAGFD